ncbi:MAG: 2-amino-4-hydroxy-6-hydroxymethyldihydropteridine diphosphokinase [Bacteroidota bacterium]|jgi:2-amino-4-hydroxy-6-hydroxymethyldihydropteridine diphosphokinase
MVHNIFLGLGSNKGNRLQFLSDAVHKIKDENKCIIYKASSIYETTPCGVIEQENFYNAVINIGSSFSPEELFLFVKKIEQKLGRTFSNKKWAPREIDIDILFYNQLIYVKDNLVIPHKWILKRDFVLIPLIEIAPDFIHPVEKTELSSISITEIEKHIITKFDYKLI